MAFIDRYIALKVMTTFNIFDMFWETNFGILETVPTIALMCRGSRVGEGEVRVRAFPGFGGWMVVAVMQELRS